MACLSRLAGGGSSPGMVFAVMSTGFTFPWEKAAMHDEELPEGLSLPDQMAYTCLRNIYFLYYNKTISRDQAAAEKQRIRVQWERAASAAEFERNTTQGLSGKQKRSRLPAGKIRQRKTPCGSVTQ